MTRQIILVWACLVLSLSTLIVVPTTGKLIVRSETMNENYTIGWTVDLERNNVTFEITAKTLGFIGFGLSPKGGMNDADVIIGGVLESGEIYFTDRFASGKQEPVIDTHQDYFLINAFQNQTHTKLKFYRALDTCDPQDLPITNDTTKFIWSMGATDDIRYHQYRGASSVNILDYRIDVVDPSKFDIWDINVKTALPNLDTVYWCTVYKSPNYTTKRHIVGLEVKLESQLAVDHNHHLILHKCYAKPGSPEALLLETYIGQIGGACYTEDDSHIVDLMDFCNAYFFVWAKGGAPLYLPENVGFPLNNGGVQEYFLLEIHYDNPHVIPDLDYATGVTVYTTQELREHDAGLMTLGHDINIALVVPPNSVSHMTVGHCSPECTGHKIPEEGINFFNILLHSHFTGRKLKLRHFRPDEEDDSKMKELAWIGVDNNFEFNYQQNRPLQNNIKILPRDQLTYECTQESTYLQPPAAVLGGAKASDEMCETHILYYPRIENLDRCGSTYPLEKIFPKFGIESLNWTSGRDPLVLAPESLAGEKYTTVINEKVDWTDEFRALFSQSVRFEPHQETCLSYNEFSTGKTFQQNYLQFSLNRQPNLISYPQSYTEYVPPSGVCENLNSTAIF